MAASQQWRSVPPAGQAAQILALEEQVAEVIANTQSKVEKMEQIIRSRSPSPRESPAEMVRQTSDYQQQEPEQQWQQEHHYHQFRPDVRDELQPIEAQARVVDPTTHGKRLEQRLKELEQEVERLSNPRCATVAGVDHTGVSVADKAQRPRRSYLPAAPGSVSPPAKTQHSHLHRRRVTAEVVNSIRRHRATAQQWSNIDASKRSGRQLKAKTRSTQQAYVTEKNQRQHILLRKAHARPTALNSSSSPGSPNGISRSYEVGSPTPMENTSHLAAACRRQQA